MRTRKVIQPFSQARDVMNHSPSLESTLSKMPAAAALGSSAPKIADTTATPAQPASIVGAALSAVMPPMATTGMLTAAQMSASRSSGMMGLSFVLVAYTAHKQHINISQIAATPSHQKQKMRPDNTQASYRS